MKKRLVLIISVLLLVVMSASLFVACGKSNNNFAKFIKKTAVPKSAEVVVKDIDAAALTLTGDMAIDEDNSSKNGIVLTNMNEKGNTVYALYDVAVGAISTGWGLNKYVYEARATVWTRANEKSGNIKDVVCCDGKVLFSMQKNEVINPNVKSPDKIVTIVYNNFAYLIKDGKQVFEQTSSINVPFYSSVDRDGICAYGKENIVQMNDYEISVYNRSNYSFVKSFDISNAIAPGLLMFSINILENGNIVVQAREILPSDVEKFDIYSEEGDLKMNIYTYVINVETAKSKEVELEYMFDSNAFHNAKTDGDAYISNYKNYAVYAYKFSDGKQSAIQTLVSFDNNMNMKFVGDSKHYIGCDSIRQIADNRYILSYDNDTKSTIVDEKGKVISVYNDVYYGNDLIYGMGFVKGNSIYDFDGKVIFDENVIGREVISAIGSVRIFQETTKVDNADVIKTYRQDGKNEKVEIVDFITSINDSIYATDSKVGTVEKATIYNTLTGAVIKEIIISDNSNMINFAEGTLCIIADGKVSLIYTTM